MLVRFKSSISFLASDARWPVQRESQMRSIFTKESQTMRQEEHVTALHPLFPFKSNLLHHLQATHQHILNDKPNYLWAIHPRAIGTQVGTYDGTYLPHFTLRTGPWVPLFNAFNRQAFGRNDILHTLSQLVELVGSLMVLTSVSENNVIHAVSTSLRRLKILWTAFRCPIIAGIYLGL